MLCRVQLLEERLVEGNDEGVVGGEGAGASGVREAVGPGVNICCVAVGVEGKEGGEVGVESRESASVHQISC